MAMDAIRLFNPKIYLAKRSARAHNVPFAHGRFRIPSGALKMAHGSRCEQAIFLIF